MSSMCRMAHGDAVFRPFVVENAENGERACHTETTVLLARTPAAGDSTRMCVRGSIWMRRTRQGRHGT